MFLKNVNNCLNTNIYFFETSGGQSSSLYLTPVLIRHLWQLKTVVSLHWWLICAALLHVPPALICLVSYVSGWTKYVCGRASTSIRHKTKQVGWQDRQATNPVRSACFVLSPLIVLTLQSGFYQPMSMIHLIFTNILVSYPIWEHCKKLFTTIKRSSLQKVLRE